MSEDFDVMTGEYGSSQIRVLEGLEAVRVRPGMYIGNTTSLGLHHLVYEVVDNSIDEALAGYCKNIEASINADGSITVVDDGRGIPTEIHPQTGKTTLETVLTVLHAGGKFGDGGYSVSGGLHGVGVSVVNALSADLEVNVWREQNMYTQKFAKGIPVGGLVTVPTDKADRTGTSVTFMPDTTIFTHGIEFDYDILTIRFRELAYLNAGIRISFADLRTGEGYTPRNEVYLYEGGIKEYISHINEDKQALHEEIIYVQGEKNKVQVEVALQWCSDAYTDNLLGFANNIKTKEGGTHLEGLKAVLTRTINSIGRKRKKLKEGDANLGGENIREGLTAIVSVKVPNPEFEGQTKTKLGNSEVRGIVETIVGETLTEFLEFRPHIADAILEKALQAFNAAEAARRARDLVRRKSVLESSPLPGKLADCSSKDPSESEIFIVEGDSAGGCFHGDTLVSLADGRNISFKEIVEEQEAGQEHFCYTIRDNGTVGIEKILHPRITKHQAQVVKVTLDNGEEIICTPDHRFMLRDGSYKPAAQLTPADSLMPLYRKFSNKQEPNITIDGYEMVWNPKSDSWLFTHMLSDWYNRWQGVYEKIDGAHCHHIDFNKLNNSPTNLQRMTAEDHLALHRIHVSKTLHRPEVIEKGRQIRRSSEFRKAMSERMSQPLTRQVLSENAIAQWQNPEYKAYMGAKWQEFYDLNPEYQKENSARLNLAQQEHWQDENNRQKQSERTSTYYIQHPEARAERSLAAQLQWNDPALKDWRKQKTQEQWTPEFRAKRKAALHQTYYQKTIKALKDIEQTNGSIDLNAYYQYRLDTRDKSLLKFETFCDRYFAGSTEQAVEAVSQYNHRIVSVEPMEECFDVYDIEVPHTHNFALASGVFVHNSAKQGRDRRTQAILPLRGKILNIEKTDDARIYKNNEVQSLIAALGLGVKGEEFNIANLRYHRVCLMTDADVDGAHIRTLLLTFFYRYQRDLIDQGFVYIACPPLYKLERGKNHFYCYSDRELQAQIATFPANANYTIQRFKGLGEMMPQQLWDTTMNPETRSMKRIEIQDAAEADRIFTILMGDRVAPRREFIETYGSKLDMSELDI
jgi:DNA gyrase subunit B